MTSAVSSPSTSEPSSLQRQPGCACRRHGSVLAFKAVSAALTQGQWCRKVHARYKELLQVKELKASLLTAAHGVDQQRALAVRSPPPCQPPSLAVCSAPGVLRPCVLGPRAACASELSCHRTDALSAAEVCGAGMGGGTSRPVAGGQSTRWPLHARPPPGFPRFRGQTDCLCCSHGPPFPHVPAPPLPRFAGMNTRSSCMHRVGARQSFLPA